MHYGGQEHICGRDTTNTGSLLKCKDVIEKQTIIESTDFHENMCETHSLRKKLLLELEALQTTMCSVVGFILPVAVSLAHPGCALEVWPWILVLH